MQTHSGYRAELNDRALRLDQQGQEGLAHGNHSEKVSLEGLADLGELDLHGWNGVIYINQYQYLNGQCITSITYSGHCLWLVKQASMSSLGGLQRHSRIVYKIIKTLVPESLFHVREARFHTFRVVNCQAQGFNAEICQIRDCRRIASSS